MKLLSGILYSAGLLIFFSACSPAKHSFYFKNLQKDTTISAFVNPNFESKIKSGDNLGISINSLSAEENAKFNSTIVSGTSTASVPSYIVSPEGTIKMHRFGEIKVEGMTVKELTAKLQADLQPYLKEPFVNVSFLNHKVTIMGSVAKPQVLTITNDNVSLIDALVLSGDVNAEGKKDNILVIRESGDKKEIKRLNLEDHSIFNSEWYYLRPNDIVYVAPDLVKADKEERRKRLQTTLSLAASGLSLIIIIIDRLLR